MAETTKKMIPTVEIISKEMIKPSSSTPTHLRTFKISSLDQFADLGYIRVLFFYNRPSAGDDAVSGETNDIIQVLKTSLSESLTHYYPLAGKFVEKDALIDCDDSGAEFTTAVIVGGDDGDFSGAIENPNMGFLEKLVGKGNSITKTEDVILAIRITRFPAGKFAVGVCISHKISDAATLCSFMKLWSAAAKILISGESSFKELIPLRPVFDAPRIFPSVPGLTHPKLNFNVENVIFRKFFFSFSSLTRLKNDLAVAGDDVPSSVTSIMALIWRTMIMISSLTKHVLSFGVNIRRKMSPPLPNTTMGNLSKVVAVKVDEPWTDLRLLLGKIKEVIQTLDDQFARKKGMPIHEPFMSALTSVGTADITITTSWCRFPFYEVDLGLGRPIWMTRLKLHILRDVLFIDGPNGGIEVIVGLDKEIMKNFEEDSTLLSFCDHIVKYE